ncbi:MAG: UPF0182 family protein, partial [Promethearchaeota archaeon]
VYDGSMIMYESPSLDKDNLLEFAKIYINRNLYPWVDSALIPDWLENQLRYPESLFERQLEVDYVYHVQDWAQWKQESDIFERPQNSDLYYVIMDLGDGLEYVSVDLVEPKSTETVTLAGMYIQRQRPDHFGEVIFYDLSSNKTLIGPSAAKQSFTAYPGIAESLSLVPGLDYGNVLLYAYAESLYYVIPVYSTTNTSLQTLNYVGLVNGFNSSEVVWGLNSQEAFDIIKRLHPIDGDYQISDLAVNYTLVNEVTLPDRASLDLTVINTNGNMTWTTPMNVNLNISINSTNATIYLNGSASGFNYTAVGSNVYYTIANWSLMPGERRDLNIEIELSLGQSLKEDIEVQVIAIMNGLVSSNFSKETITFHAQGYRESDIGFTYNITNDVVAPAMANISVQVENIGFIAGVPMNVSVRLKAFSNETTLYINNSVVSGTSFSGGIEYEIANWSLYPTEKRGLTGNLNLSLGNFSVKHVDVQLVILLENITAKTSPVETITFASSYYNSTNITSANNVILEYSFPIEVNEPSNATLQFQVQNLNASSSQNIKVNITIFSVNATVTLPDLSEVAGVDFTADPFYEDNSGRNYTIINEDLVPSEMFSTTITLDLDLTGTNHVDLAYYIVLIANDEVLGTSGIRILSWSA